MTKEQQEMEDTIMVHRYLYYIECMPMISDFEYDELDREATKILPESSPVHQVGSDLSSSYSDRIIELARELSPQLLNKKEMLDAIIACGKILDDQKVPSEGRILRFTGKDGNIYEISSDKPIPEEIAEQVPDWLKKG